MAGFLENLLRQGTQAGLGYYAGQREGQERQQQAAAQKQREELELAKLQAQIDRTGRQDPVQAPEVNPWENVEGIDPNLAALAQGLPSSVQADILRKQGQLPEEVEDVEAPDPAIAARVASLTGRMEGMEPGAEGYLSPEGIQALGYDAPGYRTYMGYGGEDAPRGVSPYDRYQTRQRNALAALEEIMEIKQGGVATSRQAAAIQEVLRFRGFDGEDDLIGALEDLENEPAASGGGEENDKLAMWTAAAQALRAQGKTDEEIVQRLGPMPTG